MSIRESGDFVQFIFLIRSEHRSKSKAREKITHRVAMYFENQDNLTLECIGGDSSHSCWESSFAHRAERGNLSTGSAKIFRAMVHESDPWFSNRTKDELWWKSRCEKIEFECTHKFEKSVLQIELRMNSVKNVEIVIFRILRWYMNPMRISGKISQRCAWTESDIAIRLRASPPSSRANATKVPRKNGSDGWMRCCIFCNNSSTDGRLAENRLNRIENRSECRDVEMSDEICLKSNSRRFWAIFERFCASWAMSIAERNLRKIRT